MIGCSLHRVHVPKPLTAEDHHVIPVAWQLLWQPAVPPFPGPDTEGRGMLWDNRTIECCPTGHRSVHALIVKLMRVCESNDPLQAYRAMREGSGQQRATAYLALCRFASAGGLLLDLVTAKEWGES